MVLAPFYITWLSNDWMPVLDKTLYLIYPFFVAIWLILDHQPPSRLTVFRMGMRVYPCFSSQACLVISPIP